MARLEARSVEECLVSAHALVGEGWSLTRDGGLRYVPSLDREVVLGELGASGEHVLRSIRALPGWADLDGDRFAERLLDGEVRSLREVTSFDCVGCYSSGAHWFLVEAAHAILETDGQRDVLEEVLGALGHVERALYIVEPTAFRERIDACDDAATRVELTAHLEHLELTVEESRAHVRSLAAKAEGTKGSRLLRHRCH